MSDGQPAKEQPKKRLPPQAILRAWGAAILGCGLSAAVLIYFFAADNGGEDPLDVIAGQKMYEHNLELMGGKFAVLTDEFNQWFANLWHGRPLAYTVAVLSVAIALGCFKVARMIAVRLPGESGEGREG